MTNGNEPYDAARHYDRVTDAWSLLLGPELHYGIFERGDEPLRDATRALTLRMFAAMGMEDGLRVLDVGCGTGAPACQLVASFRSAVVGITTSAVGVEQARARAREFGVAAMATFEIRDGTANGFPDESFDRILILESSHLMRRRVSLLSECVRAVRQGGRVALCDIVLRRPMPFEEVRRLRGPLTLLRDVFGDARMETLDWYVEHFTKAGLVVDTAEDLTESTRPTFARWRDNAALHRDAVVAQLGERDWQQFLDAAEILEQFWDDGTLGYGIVAGQRRLTT